ncbi:hypothetical protein P154DRAFT_430503 [Amniculicola lignicola CBS 123094]|uniref:Uncharacterized protein n=1 Tax=Amniculicola lignicola CBS 123094 TaxID=1392246 RepID=A0A6A5WM07_9PLEO|nr:hypothetical protein P154DRAFT_430503 [Amniculicola lignicola CBS 123094]
MEPPKDPARQTTVTIITGSAENGGGDTPLVHTRDHYGNFLSGLNDYKADIGVGQTRSWNMDNVVGRIDQPAYVYLMTRPQQNNDICLASLILSGNGATYAWTGDLGWKCGAQWYPSNFAFGGSNYPPKCVWLDTDGSGGTIAKALSLHMPDFLGEPGLQAQYGEDFDRLCKNEARMTFWPEPPIRDLPMKIFNPRPEYTEDGGLKDPDQGKDRATDGYPDGSKLPWLNNGKAKRHPRDFQEGELPKSNNKPDALTVSHLPGHSARELCESVTSLGPDFVVDNGEEKLFCDMTKKQIFDVCDEQIATHCFDTEAGLMRSVGQKLKHRKRDLSYGDVVPMKQYNVTHVWDPRSM